MIRFGVRLLIVVGLLIVAVIMSSGRPPAGPATRSICDLSRDLSAYRDRLVRVRGVYYFGLRQACARKCGTGPWPSFLWLVGTGRESWEAIEKAEHIAEFEATKGTRVEVWVTAVGWLRTMARPSLLGPCDMVGSRYYGYGHLGIFPAELQIERFTDVEVKTNSASPYDYSVMYRGPF